MAIYRINRERSRAEQHLYAADMNLVQQAVQENELGHALQLLDKHRPTGTASDRFVTHHSSLATDLRGWEWRYLWHQCQGEERFILGEHTNGATPVGMLTDGKAVFSAGKNKFVRLWDLESRRPIGLLPHPEDVIGAAPSRDSRWLATATSKYAEGQPILLWDLATQKIAARLITVTPKFANFWLSPGASLFRRTASGSLS